MAQLYDIEGITRISWDLVLVLAFLLGCEKKKREGNPLLKVAPELAVEVNVN